MSGLVVQCSLHSFRGQRWSIGRHPESRKAATHRLPARGETPSGKIGNYAAEAAPLRVGKAACRLENVGVEIKSRPHRVQSTVPRVVMSRCRDVVMRTAIEGDEQIRKRALHRCPLSLLVTGERRKE